MRVSATATKSPATARQAGDRLSEFEVGLPRSLRRFAPSVRASVMGPENGPVVVLIGGISANRFPFLNADGTPGWWNGLAGEAKAIDPSLYRIVGTEFAADDSGHIAPSTRDQADVICALLDELGVTTAHAIVGASYGGMAALSLAQHFPGRTSRLVIVSAPAEPHPMATATREIQRRIVAFGLANKAGAEGLALARGLAMLTYRSPGEFEERFRGGIDSEDALARSEPGAYLQARGQAYRSVMSPGRFISLSASIDRHRIDPEAITTPALIIGATSDHLVPPSQLTALASRYGGPAALHILPSPCGHDMFLKQADQVSALAGPFLRSTL